MSPIFIKTTADTGDQNISTKENKFSATKTLFLQIVTIISYAFLPAMTSVALKIIPHVLLCCPTSEADDGGMAVEAEPLCQ